MEQPPTALSFIIIEFTRICTFIREVHFANPMSLSMFPLAHIKSVWRQLERRKSYRVGEWLQFWRWGYLVYCCLEFDKFSGHIAQRLQILRPMCLDTLPIGNHSLFKFCVRIVELITVVIERFVVFAAAIVTHWQMQSYYYEQIQTYVFILFDLFDEQFVLNCWNPCYFLWFMDS